MAKEVKKVNKSEYKKLWYIKNKERILSDRKKYYLDNIDKLLLKSKKHR